jgi:hypothetical protein
VGTLAACARSDLTLIAQADVEGILDLARNNPNRDRSFAGAARAADRAGDRVHARSYYEKLVSLAGNADTARPDLIAAKQYKAGK